MVLNDCFPLSFPIIFNRQVREVKRLMFGDTRVTSASLGSSEDEEPLLFAVLFRIWGIYILSILCINHQFGATEKVPFKILLPVLPYFR